MQSAKLIVGLGNPGKSYEKTRHNLGFMVVDELVRRWKLSWHWDEKTESLRAVKRREGSEIILAKPLTFMNASGFAVKKLIANFQLPISNLWIVHDDLDLPLGKIKIKIGGGAAGHHGVESIIKELGSEDFVRFRLGIGHLKENSKLKIKNEKLKKMIERYLLSPFDQQEKDEVERMVKRAVEAVEFALEEGLEKAVARKF